MCDVIEHLLKMVITKGNTINPRLTDDWFITKNQQELLNKIYEMTKFSNGQSMTLSRRVKFILNGITEWPKCPECNTTVKWHPSTMSFSEYCSQACSARSDTVKEKLQATSLERYGVKHPFQSEELKCKIKATNLERYGYENAAKSPEIREKIKQKLLPIRDKMLDARKLTCAERYGVEFPLMSIDVRNKGKTTCMKRHGVEYALQLEQFRDKFKATCLERYGTEHYNNRPKARLTCLERYGCEHPSQNPEIHNKQISSSSSFKSYAMPSGKIINVQGYEGRAIDVLLMEGTEECDIEVYPESIPYLFDNQQRTYFPDLYIKSSNTIVEVKSQFILDLDYDKTIAKLFACSKLGYATRLMVL